MIKYIVLFILYIIIHVVIGKLLEQKKNEYNAFKNHVTEKEMKNVQILFTWFPFMYVAVVILLLLI